MTRSFYLVFNISSDRKLSLVLWIKNLDTFNWKKTKCAERTEKICALSIIKVFYTEEYKKNIYLFLLKYSDKHHKITKQLILCDLQKKKSWVLIEEKIYLQFCLIMSTLMNFPFVIVTNLLRRLRDSSQSFFFVCLWIYTNDRKMKKAIKCIDHERIRHPS